MPTNEQLARAAGKIAGRAVKNLTPTVRQSEAFAKHVVPAAVKPLHSLWHEILGFMFLVFAGIAAFKLWQHPGALPPIQLGIVMVFIVVLALYGISSIRKARQISRS